jgi:trigger factor
VAAIAIDELDLVSIYVSQSGELYINADLFNLNGERIFSIRENSIVYSSERIWDVIFKGKALTIREQKGNILLDIHFNPPHKIIFKQGILSYNDIVIMLNPRYILIANNKTYLRGITTFGSGAALHVGIA